MLEHTPVLIVEDEAVVAIDLAFAVADNGGEVIGPAHSIEEAFRILPQHPVQAAILDFELNGRDVVPLARHLFEADIPFVFHTANALPLELAEQWPEVPVLLKPCPTALLMETLAGEIRKRADRARTAA
ncbi:MAG: response regulator [Novosphingobium sp.]|nr:response regulator [Novosphingobium sp.]